MKGIKFKEWLLGTFVMLVTTLLATSCIMGNEDLPDCKPEINTDAPLVTANAYCNNVKLDWEEDSRIGVYLIDNEKECLLQDSLGAPYLLDNMAASLFLPYWNESNQALTFPSSKVYYDAIGVYPYGTSLSNTKSLSLSILDQKKPEMLDIFTAHRVKQITSDTDTIHLDLYRRMSRFLFNLKLTEVKADKSEVAADEKLAGAKILVKGLPANGIFMLTSDQLEVGSIQSFQAYMAESGKAGQAVVFPGKITQDISFQISLPQYPDTVYSFILDKSTELEACRSYELDFNLKHIIKPEEKQYQIKYRYEGAANKNNVTVKRGSSPISWSEGDIIKVDENSNFTFSYESNLKVSVRTEEGETLTMTPGTPYTFTQIHKDITIIIKAEEPAPEKKTHKVTYIFRGDANKNNVAVYKNGMTTSWPKEETIVIEDKKDFSFGFRSDLDVTTTVDGKIVQIESGKAYTIPEVTKDIVIVISAEIPTPPAPNHYEVKYIREGKHAQENITVTQGKGPNNFGSWIEKAPVTVTEGSSFTFKHEKSCNDCIVKVMVKEKELPMNPDGTYTFTNIRENITIVISTNLHHITYVFDDTEEVVKNRIDVAQNSSEWALTTVKTAKTGDDFIFNCNVKTGNEEKARIIYVKENGTDVPVTTNTYTLSDIRSDKEIHIRALQTYTVYYTFAAGTTAPEGFNIKGKGNTTSDDWQEGAPHKIIVDAKSDFTFELNKDLEVSSTGGNFAPNGYVYTTKDINSDIVITLKAAKAYVSITIPDGITCDKNSDYVTNNSEFTFKPQYPADKPGNRYQFVVKYKKKSEDVSKYTPIDPENDGSTFKLPNNVTEDMDIDIMIVRKPADIRIIASVKEWTELKTVNGGSMYPD